MCCFVGADEWYWWGVVWLIVVINIIWFLLWLLLVIRISSLDSLWSPYVRLLLLLPISHSLSYQTHTHTHTNAQTHTPGERIGLVNERTVRQSHASRSCFLAIFHSLLHHSHCLLNWYNRQQQRPSPRCSSWKSLQSESEFVPSIVQSFVGSSVQSLAIKLASGFTFERSNARLKETNEQPTHKDKSFSRRENGLSDFLSAPFLAPPR